MMGDDVQTFERSTLDDGHTTTDDGRLVGRMADALMVDARQSGRCSDGRQSTLNARMADARMVDSRQSEGAWSTLGWSTLGWTKIDRRWTRGDYRARPTRTDRLNVAA